MATPKSHRPWYRSRLLPLLVALLSVTGGLVAYFRENVVMVDELEVNIIDVIELPPTVVDVPNECPPP